MPKTGGFRPAFHSKVVRKLPWSLEMAMDGADGQEDRDGAHHDEQEDAGAAGHAREDPVAGRGVDRFLGVGGGSAGGAVALVVVHGSLRSGWGSGGSPAAVHRMYGGPAAGGRGRPAVGQERAVTVERTFVAISSAAARSRRPQSCLAVGAGDVVQEGLRQRQRRGLVALVAGDLVRHQDDRVGVVRLGGVRAQVERQVGAGADDLGGGDALGGVREVASTGARRRC